MSAHDVRAGELLALAIAEDIDLRMTVDDIVALEDAGYIVDLISGELLSSVTPWPTVLGEATVVVLDTDEVKT